MAATLRSVAGEGEYGELIKNLLSDWRTKRGLPPLSYAQLVNKMNAAGVRDPRTNEPMTKSRIGSYASGRAMAPRWFLIALGQALGGPQEGFVGDWWTDQSNILIDKSGGRVSTSAGISMRMVVADLARPTSEGGLTETYMPNKKTQTSERIQLPAILDAETCVAWPVDSDFAMPFYRPGNVLIVDVSRTTVILGKLYATTEENGAACLRQAVWDPSKGLVLRAAVHARSRFPDAIVETKFTSDPGSLSGGLVKCFVDGMLLGHLKARVPDGQLPAFAIDPQGVDQEEW